MDPLSQAIVGAVAGQNASSVQKIRPATLLAFCSGMLADLDVLIKSTSDPLLALEYHRHFTHSLFFIPVGGLIASMMFYYVFLARKYLSFKETFLFCTAGYATHALLDACTSYGTQLLWPFSNMRVAWNAISVIDPLFTLPVLLLILVAYILRSSTFAKVALVFALTYLALGAFQNHRALDAGTDLALSRGHEPGRITAKAGFANMIIRKVVYEYDGRFYVDAVRMLWDVSIIEGESVAKLDIQRDFPWLDESSQQARDLERFARVSDNFLSVDRRDKNIIVDMRYSMLPNNAVALWGIKLSPMANYSDHVSTVNIRKIYGVDNKSAFNTLWEMILGQTEHTTANYQ